MSDALPERSEAVQARRSTSQVRTRKPRKSRKPRKKKGKSLPAPQRLDEDWLWSLLAKTRLEIISGKRWHPNVPNKVRRILDQKRGRSLW